MITSGCVYKFYDLRRWYFQHIIFKINTYDDHDALEGVKLKQGTTRTEGCEPLKAELPDDECRCAAYLFRYVNEQKRLVVKNLLINWLPDGAMEKVWQKLQLTVTEVWQLTNLCTYRRKSCTESPLPRSGLISREWML
jgi:hypothetical protein